MGRLILSFRNRLLPTALAALLLGGLLALSLMPPAARAAAQPAPVLNVVATTTHIQNFVRNVGGDRVNVLPILPPASDPHDYQPTAEDARKLAQADIIFANGLGFESWLDDLVGNARQDVLIVYLAETSNRTLRVGEEHEEHGGELAAHDEPLEYDPHVWYDPTNVQAMVSGIRDILIEFDPDGSEMYTANAAAYDGELAQLDLEIAQQIATIPTEQRKMVTNHDAFGYYIDRYGLIFVGSVLPSLSTETQPSAAEVQELVEKIKAQGVKAIFTEEAVNPRLEAEIARQTGIKVVSNLFADSLGLPGSEGDTYLKAMRHNTRVIVEALR
jgi:ABC-type Zn uptake system ZnuABC Zn-binding protein ZnuA